MSTYRNIVFEGGGVWGIAYEGVLAQLHEKNAIDFKALHRVGGASAGAITACLLSVGYQPDELGAILKKTDFKSFQDHDLGFARDTSRLLNEYGWYKGDKFKKWIRKRVRDKIKQISEEAGISNPVPRPTFAELEAWHAKLSTKGVKLPGLYVVGSNLSKQQREIYSAEKKHTPSLHIDDAVRRSMSIPLFFACARGPGRDVIVDGGLTWNFPINIFDQKKYLSTPENGKLVSYSSEPGYVFNTETLGVRLDTTKELAFNMNDWANEPMKINNVVKYGWALATFVRAIANKSHLHKNDWTRTLFVDIGEEIGFTQFDLTSVQQEFLVEAGKKGVQVFLEWRESVKGQKEIQEIYTDMAPSTD